MNDGFIAVYGDWDGLAQPPLLLGRLFTHHAAAREVFEFEFDAAQLKRKDPVLPRLDPRLEPFGGRQYPAQGQDRSAPAPTPAPTAGGGS